MANEYLTRNPQVNGDRQRMTLAGWLKLHQSNSSKAEIFLASASGSSEFSIGILNDAAGNLLQVYEYPNPTDGYIYRQRTTRAIKDYAGWFHLVVSIDTTATNSQERVRIYINGELETLFDASTYLEMPQNHICRFNASGEINELGYLTAGGANYAYKGQMMDVFLIDGQQLSADVFGYFKDNTNRQWVPKSPRVVKQTINQTGGFGANGCYLPLNNSAHYGADFHVNYDTILKINDDIPQPDVNAKSVTSVRDDPYKDYLVLACPFIDGGLQSGAGDYAHLINTSQTAKTMTITNASISSVPSVGQYYGSAAVFDGTGDYITTTSNLSDFHVGTGDFTVEAWVWKSANGSNQYDGLFSLGDNGNADDGIFMEVSSTRGIFLASGGQSGGGTFVLSHNVDPNISQWIHVAWTRHNGVTRIFRDGRVVATSNTSYDVPTNGNKFTIGVYSVSAGQYYFNGYISDFRFYNGVAKYKGGFDIPKHWTPKNLAESWRTVPDTPRNNFCTLDSNGFGFSETFTNKVIADGNLRLDESSASGSWTGCEGTIGVSSGKWYYETHQSSADIYVQTGWQRTGNQQIEQGSSQYRYRSNGFLQGSGGSQSYGNTWTTSGDIIGCALDLDAGTITFYKNGVSQGTAYSSLPEGVYQPTMCIANNGELRVNFGQNPDFAGVKSGSGNYKDVSGYGTFYYEPPQGHKALCSANLSEPAISDPSEHFQAITYIGDSVNGRSVEGFKFTPNLLLIKNQTNPYNPRLFDTVRDYPGPDNYLITSRTDRQGGTNDRFGGVSGFRNNGFDIISGTGGSNIGINDDDNTFVAYAWRASNTTVTNTSGTVNSTVAANPTAGFSICRFNTGSNPTTFSWGHGLDKAPEFIIVKGSYLDSDYNWDVYHKAVGNSDRLKLNSDAIPENVSPAPWNDTNPDANVVYQNNSYSGNGDYSWYGQNKECIAYCWHSVPGFSMVGEYRGNGQDIGPYMHTGFKPALVIFKPLQNVGGFVAIDNAINPSNPRLKQWSINVPTAQVNGLDRAPDIYLEFTSNGFRVRGNNDDNNTNGEAYAFIAFAEMPFKKSNGG